MLNSVMSLEPIELKKLGSIFSLMSASDITVIDMPTCIFII